MKTPKAPAKFVAALLHEKDKARIVDLRKQTNLTEKDLMTRIIDAAEQHVAEIVELATEQNAAEKAARELKRTENYEIFKQTMKEARAAARVKKADKAIETPVDGAAPTEAPGDEIA